MTARAPVAKDREALRELARGLVAVARERGLARLVAETEVDGAFVRVTVERTKHPGRRGAPAGKNLPAINAVPDRWEEDVAVHSGARSQPKAVFVAPASWLDTADPAGANP